MGDQAHRTPMSCARRWLPVLAAAGVGCQPTAPVTERVPEGPTYGEPVVCEVPVAGMARFREVSAEVGLTRVLPDVRDILQSEEERIGGGLAVADLDGDGHMDILAGRFSEPPDVYLNDGAGHFTLLEGAVALPDLPEEQRFALAWAAADLDGDGLPELLSSGMGYMALYAPRGDGTFEAPTLLHQDSPDKVGLYLSFSLGDPDADGDLDIMLVSNLGFSASCADCPAWVVWPDFLLINQGGQRFAPGVPFLSDPVDGGSHSMIALFTDQDGDGDQEIFVPKDYWGENALWHRGADGTWTNEVAAVGADLEWSAMGVEAVDLNGDGGLDYCVTDTGPMACLLSSPDGIFVESAAALGLIPAELDNAWETVGWSVMINDLDNDGWWDAAYTGGPMGQQQEVEVENVADVMWAGSPDGFTDVSHLAGFADTRDHYGMAQADFDGDGALEIVVTGPGAPPVYYDNACSAGHWLELALEGPALNREGWGARVEVSAGKRVWLREVLSLVGKAQSAPRVHIGLGEMEQVDRVRITWPDGTTIEHTDLPVDRLITLHAD